VDCEVAEWSAWAQCDATTGRKERTRPIVTQPEGGTACPPLEEASACSGEPPVVIDSFLHVWDWGLRGLLGWLLAQVGSLYLSASVRTRWAAAVVGGIVCALAAAIVFLAHNETVCASKRPFFGRTVLCHEWARSVRSGLADAPAYAAHGLSTVFVAFLNVPRRTANAAVAQLALFGGALAVYVHQYALSFRWVGVWIFAPCALVWAASAAWSLLRPVRSAVPAAETSFSDKAADYTRERPIGEGGFGTTWLATHRPDGRTCAIKVIKSTDENKVDQAKEECKSAQALRNAVSPSDRTLLVETYTCFVEQTKHQWRAGIVMEHCAGGNLSRYLEEKAPLSEPIACQVLKALLRALRGVHEARRVHRDLKPSNILLCATGRPDTLKLADFGLTRKVNSATSIRGGGGTRGYVSPEAERGRYVGESDMWALGVVAVQLCARPEDVRAIFDGPQVLRTEAKIAEFLALIPTGYSAAFQALARACLKLDFTVRPSAAQLLKSELFAPDLLRFHLDHLLSAEKVRPPRRSAGRFHKNRSGRCVAHLQTYGRRLKILCSVFRDPLRADLHGLSHQARPPIVVTNGAHPRHVRGAGCQDLEVIFSKSLDSLTKLHEQLCAELTEVSRGLFPRRSHGVHRSACARYWLAQRARLRRL
jgi:serine/threonine protein kinase